MDLRLVDFSVLSGAFKLHLLRGSMQNIIPSSLSRTTTMDTLDIKDSRDTRIMEFQVILDRWNGSPARLWTLSSGYPTLKLILFNEKSTGSLEITCISPARIESQHRWEDSQIVVEKSDGGMFNVLDENGGLFISECGVQLKEFSERPYLKY
jgi:hypothetical protein